MRVVIDTNVFVSMTLGGQVGEINDAWKAGQFTLILSDVILAEYIGVLARPKFHLKAETLSVIVERLQRRAAFVTPAESINVVKDDPSDNKFLEAAIAGKADYIVSGDRHLLQMKEFQSIPIITAHDFRKAIM